MRTFPTAHAPHRPHARSVRTVMWLVCATLVPGTLAQALFFGAGVVVQVLLAVAFALAVEALCLRLRGVPLQPFLGDGSAVVTAWLFALCLPPLAPWWIAAAGMLAALGLGKHAFGGLGHNPFNPAMVGYALVLLGWPLDLARWPPARGAGEVPGLADALRTIFTGTADAGWDALTRATPLAVQHDLAAAGRTLAEIRADVAWTTAGAPAWGWIAAAFALGGIALCLLRIVDWRTPAAVLLGVLVLALPPWLFDSGVHPPPLQHLASGGLVLCAFFIASDPVSGAGTPRGRWLFGIGVAALVLALRAWGRFPDGIAFAILAMNALAPLIDRHTVPRVFGR